MSEKILLALQFWEGDKAQAMKVARLITDIQPGFCDKADLLFFSRFDCSQDESTIKYVSTKFHVHHARCRNQGEGWPHGPNTLWFGAMDWLYTMRLANKVPEYKAILTFEADTAPLSPHWVRKLSEDWDAAKVKVLGALLGAPGEHINGNALFSGDMGFLKWVARDVGGCSPQGGWDYILAPQFKKRGWANCPRIVSEWQTKTATPELLDRHMNAGVVFHHGVKDDSLIRLVRSRFIR